MKTRVLLIVLLVLVGVSANAQRSNIRIGYIDTEYILENIPEYNEALSQLDKKVQKWKSEIDLKLRGIEKKKLDLRNERVLLTKELIEEKEEEIKIEEAEILDYQQKRFGPNGDLIIQKKTLIEPVQDQVLTAVQEYAKAKKYDFIFDKSADVVMMYSNKRYDISDYIVRKITRAASRKQAKDRKSKKAAEQEDVIPVINEAVDERKKTQAENKAKRLRDLEERRQKVKEAKEAKIKAFAEKREKMLAEKEAKKEARKNKITGPPTVPVEENNEENK